MKKVTISKMTAREIILITSAFRKPHFTGAEINGNRSYALPLSIRDSKKDFPLLRDGKPFAFENVFHPFYFNYEFSSSSSGSETTSMEAIRSPSSRRWRMTPCPPFAFLLEI